MAELPKATSNRHNQQSFHFCFRNYTRLAWMKRINTSWPASILMRNSRRYSITTKTWTVLRGKERTVFCSTRLIVNGLSCIRNYAILSWTMTINTSIPASISKYSALYTHNGYGKPQKRSLLVARPLRPPPLELSGHIFLGEIFCL